LTLEGNTGEGSSKNKDFNIVGEDRGEDGNCSEWEGGRSDGSGGGGGLFTGKIDINACGLLEEGRGGNGGGLLEEGRGGNGGGNEGGNGGSTWDSTGCVVNDNLEVIGLFSGRTNCFNVLLHFGW